MKIRTGFVANSSSSSFVCDFCDESFEGLDACPSDFEHYECVNGHIFCDEALVGDLPEDHDEGCYEIPEENCPLCTFVRICDRDMKNYMKKKYGISESSIFEKVKAVNKRRKKLYDSEYISGVLVEVGITSDVVEKEIREFKSYSEFKSYVKGN